MFNQRVVVGPVAVCRRSLDNLSEDLHNGLIDVQVAWRDIAQFVQAVLDHRGIDKGVLDRRRVKL